MRLYRILGVFLFLIAARAAEDAVVTEGKINVRGKPSLIGEVITQLERGETVTVLERITNSTARPGEPTNWAKITLPANTPVWVFAPFVKDGVVSVSRLNVRAGRGENYSVIGRLNRGEEVKPIRTVAEWMEIQQPTNAYAFIALDLLDLADTPSTAPATTTEPQPPTIASQTTQQLPGAETPEPSAAEPAPGTATTPEPPLAATTAEAGPTNNPPTVATATPEVSSEPVNAAARTEGGTSTESRLAAATPAPTSEPVATTPDSAVTQGEPAATGPAIATTTTPSPEIQTPAEAVSSPLPAPEDLPKVAEPVAKRSEPLPKRVVRREGIVRATSSIQAPTWYELVHADTKKRINYLFEENMGINLKDYRGQKVVVSGEEAIDPRWPNTPILDMQSLDVLPNDDSR